MILNNAALKFIAILAAHPRVAALALGVLAACGFQPLGLWPLTLLAVAGLIELTARAESGKQAALIGWLFGIGHFTLGNNWIATAFTYQANMPKWLGWIAVVVLALYLAVYPLLATLGAWLLSNLHRRPRERGDPASFATSDEKRDPRVRGGDGLDRVVFLLAFAGCWIVAEWLRSWAFTGYAWNPLGMTALGGFTRPGLAAAAPWLGTYALSGLVVLLAGCWLLAAHRRDWRAAVLALVPVGLFLLPSFAGEAEKGTLPYTLVQPDIRQEDLDNPALFEKQFVKTARLTLPRARGTKRIVLWPESGVPDYLREGYPLYFYRQMTHAADPLIARRRIGYVVGPGSMLLTGTVDLEVHEGDAVAARNSVTAIDAAGNIKASYYKAHLVPYGEYLPMRQVLEPIGLSRLVPGALDFWPGPGPRTLQLGPWGKAGIQICYEIVFSGQVTDRRHRPDYLFNPSNDGWFGSFGPPQHLAQARMRAIEEGLPVLRSTTTGISAVIDADGIVRRHIPRHVAARLDGLVPPAHAPTLFARLGNMLPLGWAAVLLVASLVAMRRRGR